jgi:ABC-2 type transport system permease protein
MMSCFFILTGAIIPRSELPGVLRAVGEVMPVTHALEGTRKAYEGSSLGSIAGDIGLEALVALGYVVVGYVMFRVIETFQRRTGAYDE